MKRLVPACFCIVVAMLMSVCSYGFVKRKTAEFGEKIDAVLQMNDEDILEGAGELCNSWKSIENAYGILLKHSDADMLETDFLMMKFYADMGQTDELRELLADCRTAFTVIGEGEKPASPNIF